MVFRRFSRKDEPKEQVTQEEHATVDDQTLDDEHFLMPKYDGGSIVRVYLRGRFLYEATVQVDSGDEIGPRTKGLRDIMWGLSPKDVDGKYRLNLPDSVLNIVNDVRRPRPQSIQDIQSL